VNALNIGPSSFVSVRAAAGGRGLLVWDQNSTSYKLTVLF